MGDLVGRLDDTLFVVFGDHGEAHWEFPELDRWFADSRPNYSCGHGGTPFDTVSRVRVEVSDPELVPTGGRASLIDLPRTLTSPLGESDRYPGIDWQYDIPTDRVVFCEGTRYGTERKAVYQDDRKIIASVEDDVFLSAFVRDGNEQFDEEADFDDLRAELPDAWGDADSSTATSKMIEDQLRALGYK